MNTWPWSSGNPNGVSSTREVGKVHAASIESGQKINELEERTEEMANKARNDSRTTHKLMLYAKNI